MDDTAQYVMVGCPSLCPSHLSTAAARAAGLLLKQEISIDSCGGRAAGTTKQARYVAGAGAQQQMWAVSQRQPTEEVEQRLVRSWINFKRLQ